MTRACASIGLPRCRWAWACVALVLWASVCVSAENDEDALRRAREAAANDRHREAIDLYLRAIDGDPLLRATVSLELGHQYTWAEMPDSAIFWYEIHLRENPGNLDARIGIARALSWADRLSEAERHYEALVLEEGERRNEIMLGLAKTNAWRGNHGKAEKIYREILNADASNTDAKLGLAETANWSGKHREAGAMFASVLAADDENADAVKGLAEAQLWMGRPDRAVRTLERAFESGVRDDPLDRLAGAIRRSRRPRGDTGFSHRENRDDGVMQTGRTSLTFPVGYLTEVGAAYAVSKLEKSGYPDIDRDEVSLLARHRFSDSFAATAAPGYQMSRFDAIVPGPGPESMDAFDLFVWDAYMTVTPGDWVRVDAGTSRRAMDVPLPVFRRIHVTTENVGLDWRFVHRLATFWEAKYSGYSDGNSRVAASERMEWTSPVRLPYRAANRFVFVQGAEYSRFAKQPDNGYFSPSNYLYTYGGVRFSSDAGKRVTLTLDGRLGGEKESGNDWASIGSFEGTIRARLAQSVFLSGGYYKSGSRLESPDGFRAEGFFVTLEYGGP